MKKSSIFKTLEKIGVTSKKTRVLFNNRTRDVSDLEVWKDSISGVIYIDDFYTGDKAYVDGSYKADRIHKIPAIRSTNALRRMKSHLNMLTGKKVLDFGCGSGELLRLIKPYCLDVTGIELEQEYIDKLNKDGITCFNSLDSIKDNSIDCVVSYHVIEHLPDPLKTLSELISKLVSGGKVLIEVPHAKDLLLSYVPCEKFKQFTLWSQHLILHTRESLRKTLEIIGLRDIQIEGVQRYPLSNHLYWLSKGEPGGHTSSLSMLDTNSLSEAYQNSLARIDATDTLVALAKKP